MASTWKKNSPRNIEYTADLGAAAYQEAVHHVIGRTYVLERNLRKIVFFVASPAQVRKIRARKGRLNITWGMIDKARETSKYGRSATRPRSTRKGRAARIAKKRTEARRRKRGVRGYYTVIVPWSDRPTAWHPTDRHFSPLSRGAFKTKADARVWADAKLRGQPYRIKRI